MQIYKLDTKQLQLTYSLEELLSQLPTEMHERARRFHFAKDAFNYVGGRMLIKRGLEERNIEEHFEQLFFNEKGKPFLADQSLNLHFNISHSGQMVVCVFSENGPIGIDVELKREIDLNDFNRFFMPHELNDIRAAENPTDRFYWYWTRKESIIKALGVDLSYLHKISLDSGQDIFMAEGEKWYLTDYDFGGGYVGAICTGELSN